MRTYVLIVVLMLALVAAVGFLWRELRGLRKEIKRHLRELGMWRKNSKKTREVELRNSKLFLENAKLRAALGADRIKEVFRSVDALGPDSILDADSAHEALKFIRDVHDSAKQIVIDLYNKEGRSLPENDNGSMSN